MLRFATVFAAVLSIAHVASMSRARRILAASGTQPKAVPSAVPVNYHGGLSNHSHPQADWDWGSKDWDSGRRSTATTALQPSPKQNRWRNLLRLPPGKNRWNNPKRVSATALDIATEEEMAKAWWYNPQVWWSDANTYDEEAVVVLAVADSTKAASDTYTQAATATVKAQTNIAKSAVRQTAIGAEMAIAKAQLISAINAENRARKLPVNNAKKAIFDPENAADARQAKQLENAIAARQAKETALAKAEAHLVAAREAESKARIERHDRYEKYGFGA